MATSCGRTKVEANGSELLLVQKPGRETNVYTSASGNLFKDFVLQRRRTMAPGRSTRSASLHLPSFAGNTDGAVLDAFEAAKEATKPARERTSSGCRGSRATACASRSNRRLQALEGSPTSGVQAS
jgi:hypothetical protein